jgi:hypothetical protein
MMFDDSLIKERRAIVLLKRASLLLLGIYAVILMIAGYRAYYQVASLELQPADSILRSGSTVRTTVISYARTPVEVRLDLIQGTHSETLAIQHVPDNEWALFDPRRRQASQTVLLTEGVLKRFERGQARLRATATGRPQWMRLPPPLVRELGVEIQ